MLLDIGGQNNRNDQNGLWKVVDLHAGADFRVNLEQEILPVENESVDYVYTSHTIEHIEPNKLRSVFAEIFRVMKHQSTLRMVVPDFRKGVDHYFHNPNKLYQELMPRPNSNTPDTAMSRLSSWFYTEENPINGTPGHKSTWDFELAKAYLEEARFCNVQERSLYECHPAFKGKDNPGYEEFSMYIECTKWIASK
ncbi:class I SAM-dependent methyltransferase [Synechococcus sp. AH-224-I15]|nr:class I SAM-dependent methyltransferase [Synechococcus sp. AH-224-I15]